MIHIYKEELDEFNRKLITNELIKVMESRIFTFGLYQFWPFSVLVHLLLLNQFLLCYLSIPREIIKKKIENKWVNVTMRVLL